MLCDNDFLLAEAEKEERRIGLQILADSEKLKVSWADLQCRVQAWSLAVNNVHADMQELDKSVGEALLAISALEDELLTLRAVEDLRLEELKEARIETLVRITRKFI